MKAVLAGLAGAMLVAAGLASAAPAPRGLIVRLKDAPAHTALEQRADRRLGEERRWRGVLEGAGLSARSGRIEPRRRAVGRDQQLLDFGRPLDAAEVERLRTRLRQRPEVDWVEANAVERRLETPSDPQYTDQWWLFPVAGTNASPIQSRRRGVPDFQTAWSSGITGATGVFGARVAVLDTGVTDHPELTGRVLPGYDFVSDVATANDGDGRDNVALDPGDWVSGTDLTDPAFDGCVIEDSSWHGTTVSGIVAARTDNGLGIAAPNWRGVVLPVRVAGKCGATVADIVDGMRWAAGLSVPGVPANPNPARILNISFGGASPCGDTYRAAIRDVTQRGAVVVAAAGNEWGAPTRPANCAGAVGVVALNRDGFKSNYSNFGAELAASGVATVGGDDEDGAWGALLADGGLRALTNLGRRQPGSAGYADVFGTSFAAPVAAATLSLMLSVNPALTAAQLVEGLRASVRPHVVSQVVGSCSDDNPGRCICTTQTCGAGIVDAARALQWAERPDTWVAPTLVPANIDAPEVLQAAALGPDREGSVAPPPTGGGDTGGGGFEAAFALALGAAAMALVRRRRVDQGQGTKPGPSTGSRSA